MTQVYPTRNCLWFTRADRPNPTTLPSSFVGGTPLTFTVGTPQLLPVATEIGGDRAVNCSGHLAGPTSARPNPLTDADFQSLAGTVYFDTSLSQAVVHDGVSWRNIFTGAVV